jgi:hypothetical protein
VRAGCAPRRPDRAAALPPATPALWPWAGQPVGGASFLNSFLAYRWLSLSLNHPFLAQGRDLPVGVPLLRQDFVRMLPQ